MKPCKPGTFTFTAAGVQSWVIESKPIPLCCNVNSQFACPQVYIFPNDVETGSFKNVGTLPMFWQSFSTNAAESQQHTCGLIIWIIVHAVSPSASSRQENNCSKSASTSLHDWSHVFLSNEFLYHQFYISVATFWTEFANGLISGWRE